MAGTRIASVSGLRGVVGDGLDPAIVADFAAAYASGLGPGPIVVGHDGRVSAPVFLSGGPLGRHGDRTRRPPCRAGRHAHARPARPRPRGGRRHPDLGVAQPAEVQRLEVLPAGRDGPRAGRGAGDARPPRSPGPGLGELGRSGQGPDDRGARRPSTWSWSWRRWTSRRSVAASSPSRSTPATARAGGWARRCSGPWGARRSSWAAIPDGRYDHPPEPTEANLAAVLRARPGPRRGGRVRPGPRRRPPGDRRRDRPLHRRGADAGPGRLAPAERRRSARSCSTSRPRG